MRAQEERLGNGEEDRMIISIECQQPPGGRGEGEGGRLDQLGGGEQGVFTSYSSSTLDPLVFLSIAVSQRRCRFFSPRRWIPTDSSLL